MKVLYVTAEMAPYAKTGGLGDVAGALPPALKKLGIDIRVIMPDYPCVAETNLRPEHCEINVLIPIGPQLYETHLHLAEHHGVPLLLVRNQEFFLRSGIYGEAGEGYADNGERFGLFCRAVLRLLPQTGFQPDLIHINDWHGALIPTLLKHELTHIPYFASIKTLLTIHNLAYNGVFENRLLQQLDLDPSLGNVKYLGFGEGLSLLKGGIVDADRVATVSPTYAAEICTPPYGHGLDKVLRSHHREITGIINGIDTQIWNPANDPLITAPYAADSPAGKQSCKHLLQQELGLESNDNRPLFGMVTRLDHQKGLDLVAQAVPQLITLGGQLVILGEGDQDLAATLSRSAHEHPRQVTLVQRFDERLAHRIYAGSDLLLMPSRYEPCGLTQLIALRYGTVPVTRHTGGLADTIVDADASPQSGNGFSFNDFKSEALVEAVSRAIACYRDPQRWQQIRQRGLLGNYSWIAAAKGYQQLYDDIAGEQT